MRLRITFSKSGGLRYTGHLDMQTTWERVIRRAGLPLAYTQGFHPGPRIQIASALPLGFIGHAEIVDIWLQESVGVDLRVDPMTLQPAAPPGLTILCVEQVDEAGPALQTQVDSAEYMATLLDPMDEAELAKRIAAVLDAESLPRERRGKAYDLRPLIDELRIMHPSPGAGLREALSWNGDTAVSKVVEGTQRVFMRLAARPGATARPEEVLDVLGIPFEAARIERTRLILKTGLE